MITDVTIEQLIHATDTAAQQIAVLLPQLTENQDGIDAERLSRVLATPGALYVARKDGVILGMVHRIDVHHVVRTKSWIEDFVVDVSVRSQGIATKLLAAAIAGAPVEASSINLTSKSTRSESHHIYAKLGFEQRSNTTLWRRLI